MYLVAKLLQGEKNAKSQRMNIKEKIFLPVERGRISMSKIPMNEYKLLVFVFVEWDL